MFILPAAAQKNGRAVREKQRKELTDFKIKYLIQEMELSADKQQAFENTYRQMENERFNLFRSVHKQVKAVKKRGEATDAELQEAADAMASLKKREGEMEYRYYQKFKKILSPEQLYIMKVAEEKFNRKVMEMRGKDKGRPAPPRK